MNQGMSAMKPYRPACRTARLPEIDFLRCLSMLAVITIHVTSTYLHGESRVLILGMNLSFLLNQAARFSVPMFLLLSGFSLGLAGDPPPRRPFWKKKALQTLPPYLLWTGIYTLSNVDFHLPDLASRCRDPLWVVKTVLTGQAAPHLYFIPILLQLYLLYPLLARWVRRDPTGAVVWSLLTSLLAQGWCVLADLGRVPALPYLWLVFPAWLFYFVLGNALAGLGPDRLPARRHRALLLLTGAVLLLYSVSSSLTGMIHAVKPSLLIVTPLVLLSAFALWRRVDCPALRAVVRTLAARSMEIYYCHVLVLTWLRRAPLPQTGTRGMLVLLLTTALLSTALAWPLSALKKTAVPHPLTKLSS